MRKLLLVFAIIISVMSTEIQQAKAYHCDPFYERQVTVYYGYGLYGHGCEPDPTVAIIVLAGLVIVLGVSIAVVQASNATEDGFFKNQFQFTPVVQKDKIGTRFSLNW